MEQNKKVVLAVDMGGSKYIGGLVDGNGQVLYSKRQEWDSFELDAVLGSISGAIEDALAHAGEHAVSAIGMTIPGLADPEKGLYVYSDVMEIRDWPVASIISQKYGWPTFVDNDGRACALAEHYFGAGQGCRNYLYITVSNGVGGALFLDGKVFYGTWNNAGEVGQNILERDAATSKCGRAGNLEDLASAKGIIKNYVYLGGQPWIDGVPASGKSIDRLAREGDAVALETYRLEGLYLGRAIADVYNVLDLEKVIIGGGLSLGFDLFGEALMEAVHEGTFGRTTPFLQVEPTPLKYEGALVGAAALALRGIGAKP